MVYPCFLLHHCFRTFFWFATPFVSYVDNCRRQYGQIGIERKELAAPLAPADGTLLCHPGWEPLSYTLKRIFTIWAHQFLQIDCWLLSQNFINTVNQKLSRLIKYIFFYHIFYYFNLMVDFTEFPCSYGRYISQTPMWISLEIIYFTRKSL